MEINSTNHMTKESFHTVRTNPPLGPGPKQDISTLAFLRQDAFVAVWMDLINFSSLSS
jgi:hypothetical protein